LIRKVFILKIESLSPNDSRYIDRSMVELKSIRKKPKFHSHISGESIRKVSERKT